MFACVVFSRYAAAARSVISWVACFHDVEGSSVMMPRTTWLLKRFWNSDSYACRIRSQLGAIVSSGFWIGGQRTPMVAAFERARIRGSRLQIIPQEALTAWRLGKELVSGLRRS